MFIPWNKHVCNIMGTVQGTELKVLGTIREGKGEGLGKGFKFSFWGRGKGSNFASYPCTNEALGL